MQIGSSTQAVLLAKQRLSQAQDEFQVSMERLASGKRINRAADDAAGMAIANSLRTQEQGTAVAIRNAVDAISLTQVADGALSEMNDLLQRMRELAVQASNGTYNDTQRGYLDEEGQQLLNQVGDIGSKTKFNSIALLDGTFTTRLIHQITHKTRRRALYLL